MLTSYMNINRINCRHTIWIIGSCWNEFRSTCRNTFRIACRITCRSNPLETHFEIYSPSIGVCKNVSISRNKRTNQSQQNKTNKTGVCNEVWKCPTPASNVQQAWSMLWRRIDYVCKGFAEARSSDKSTAVKHLPSIAPSHISDKALQQKVFKALPQHFFQALQQTIFQVILQQQVFRSIPMQCNPI